MASSYSSDLKLELQVTGENASTWGTKTNNNLNLLQQAISGYQSIDVASSDVTLAMTDASVNSIIIESEQFISIPGQQINTSIGTYTVSAGGAITVVVPEFTLNTSLGNPIISTTEFIGITGQEVTVELNSIVPSTTNLISIIGQQANSNLGSIIISSSNVLDITGQEMTMALATVITSTGNTISLTGQQMTVIPATLRFWDPIPSGGNVTWTDITTGNTVTWTNI